ncbi:MAG: 2Fe-2S iron-sulfur cluster binding domain-containing protein [Flavobacteriaceae bacterium]|nr:MAG: 2Fe-2S iron-sulfur cluster binding domain-containing protein [Flavobacteriaceae bacterium]
MSIFHKLRVKEVRRETSDAVSVAFEIPNELEKEFKFIPGQYITVQKDLQGNLLRRAYSICSSPNSSELRVAVKEVEKGRFSQFANKILKEGDRLDVAGPEGRFVLEAKPDHKRDYLAIAAGSGITPVISMIKSVLEDEKDSRFVLLYGSKSGEKTIFKKELDELAARHENRLKVQYVFSQIISDKALFGRIEGNMIKELLKGDFSDYNFDNYFICGPEEMIDSVKQALIKLGIKEDDINFELFTSTSHKKEINKSLEGNAEITVILDEEETTYEMRMDELILDAALVKGLDAPYSCQGGVCSSCLAKVVEGSAVMERNTILDQDEIDEGLILTCQAHPTSSKIKIDYDDV